MNRLYNIILINGKILLAIIARLSFLLSTESKLKKFAKGQQGLIKQIQAEMSCHKNNPTPVIWLHAASLGEYGVARPIIKQLKQRSTCRIVLTFFSPTGYEALHIHHPEIDHIFYLPLDTPKNARTFIDTIHPQKTIFIISEYWINYLNELRMRNIPTFLISAVISRNAPFFKWYGGLFRSSLETFTHFLVLNRQSGENLQSLGYRNFSVTGDPLFDNAIAVASTPYQNPIVEKFAYGKDVFIAGSVSDRKDLQLICHLANRYRDVRFIIVPHEISEEVLNDIKFNLDGYALCYSECDADTDFSDTQTLIIDYLGALAFLYRYGKWAYVGGGFTPYLHSIIEATVYGLPVAFGPMIQRKVTPNELMELGIGQVVRSEKELEKWFEALRNEPQQLKQIKNTALDYSRSNSGATSNIIQILA
ncbi:3-deoxy-D-manno-octulosonic acid transferase [Bacteroides caecimuris]|uniref:3-deoxy-D-manno-octulosonic acid transferase n=1 Tax=Bacteroides caecimuris TaxID=1796613 RepID=UPI001C3C34DF|nr:glycosyltransferase N-terminal domain-containing protein [Bacteroides caecimuris]